MLTGIVPCGGYGSRLASLIGNGPKALLPVGGQALVEHSLRKLRELGVDLAILTVSPHTLQVQEVIGDNYQGLPVKYVLQDPPQGLLDAVYQTRDIVQGDCITLLSDELYVGADHNGLIEYWRARQSLAALVGYLDGATWSAISRNYSIQITGKRVVRMVEKPVQPVNSLLGTGTWVFGPRFFEYAARALADLASGKRAFVDALQLMIDGGLIVEGYDLGGRYININYPSDVEAAQGLLASSAPTIEPQQ